MPGSGRSTMRINSASEGLCLARHTEGQHQAALASHTPPATQQVHAQLCLLPQTHPPFPFPAATPTLSSTPLTQPCPPPANPCPLQNICLLQSRPLCYACTHTHTQHTPTAAVPTFHAPPIVHVYSTSVPSAPAGYTPQAPATPLPAIHTGWCAVQPCCSAACCCCPWQPSTCLQRQPTHAQGASSHSAPQTPWTSVTSTSPGTTMR